ncbi:MAG: dihydrofolate reductase [Hyphomonadaceae bacterium]|nr:dihydrofolate reductase [Hyphomonadaceae bacterium]
MRRSGSRSGSPQPPWRARKVDVIKLTLVVAVAKNGVIGRDGALPWRLSSDLKRFKAATMGKPVLMGRKTWESLPKRPLPGRANLVLTRDASFVAEGARVFSSLDAMLAAGRAIAQASGADEVCVIGGAQVYEATLPLADRIVLTEVNLEPEGNARLDLDLSRWRDVSREAVARGPNDEADFLVRVLERGLLPREGEKVSAKLADEGAR